MTNPPIPFPTRPRPPEPIPFPSPVPMPIPAVATLGVTCFKSGVECQCTVRCLESATRAQLLELGFDHPEWIEEAYGSDLAYARQLDYEALMQDDNFHTYQSSQPYGLA